METIPTDDGHLVLSLASGEDVLESIRTACADHDVENGAVISAIGTLRNLHVHYLNTDDLTTSREDRNDFYALDGCWEVSGVSGMIADGEPHLHVIASDGERTVAGHLEAGNEVNALFEVLIRELDGPALTRRRTDNDVPRLQRR